MASSPTFLHLYLLVLFLSCASASALPNPELSSLMALKESLDPQHHVLSTWTNNGEPCSGTFVGVACNIHGKVTSISLQGMGLSGSISPAIAGLRSLTGLYLHYNRLTGEIPREVGNLTLLSDFYLDVNRLQGSIPVEIGSLGNLQVLQLGYNRLTGNIPTQLGRLKKLSVLTLQYNQLTGAIPASLGDLPNLMRLDLSFNHLFGSIPAKLVQAPLLTVLDLRNNSLSGDVPSGLKRLNGGFQFANNKGLCGAGFDTLKLCPSSEPLDNPSKPEPFGPGLTGLRTQQIPQSANLGSSQCPGGAHCSKTTKSSAGTVIGALVLAIGCAIVGLFTFLWYRRRKQKIGSSLEISDSRLSTDQLKEPTRKSSFPLVSVEYNTSWDMNNLSDSHRFNLEEVEFATQYFSEVNLLGKSIYMGSTYKGILRDGAVVAVRSINRSSCKQEEAEFLKGLKVLTLLRHENVLRLRGFCCSRGRGECFLIYDYAANGSLVQYFDLKSYGGGLGNILDWATRVSIINGIAKGIEYLHNNRANKPSILHQNISAEKILLDLHYVPKLSCVGLHKLLADDINFSTLKASAAMGYLAPEYATTGRFTEKSDVYAFGLLILQIITGKLDVSAITINGEITVDELQEIIDDTLDGRFSKKKAVKLVQIARDCMSEASSRRPSMEMVVELLS
ncbi:Protein NSP-INTERACTING KINASE 2 [Rhynchospora pubera]|uniref:Protein NSP-INTERACTING KINASE 2 n=1 Tax=Rhynchospora pubera TaxID=906938 RepID=A0AAV8EE48_9POAL|nr:Protein NSP-INTERACTING KINASE 2 [Rhynchospora pubera]